MNAAYSDVTYGNGHFVAPRSDTKGVIASSIDGLHWAQHPTGVPGYLYKIVQANNVFVAAGQPGILTSADGTNWMQTVTGFSSGYGTTGIAYGNGVFVVRLIRATFVSSNAFDWVQVSQPIPTLGALAFANGVFVNFGISGSLATSTNGFDWVSGVTVTGIPGVGAVDVAGMHDRFVAPTGNSFPGPNAFNGVLTSTDAINWSFPAEINTQVTVPTTAVGFAGDLAFLFGRDGEIFSSSDLTNWVQSKLAVGEQHNRVAFGANRFVVAGYPTLVSAPYSPGAVTGRFTDVSIVSGGARLSMKADFGATVGVEASSDLVSWRPIANVNFAIPDEQFTDEGATKTNTRFYRLSVPSNGLAKARLTVSK